MADKSWSDSLTDILGGLVTGYATVETAKAQAAVEKAKASYAAMGLPYGYTNPGVLGLGYTQQLTGQSAISNMMPILLIAGVVVAVVLVVKS